MTDRRERRFRMHLPSGTIIDLDAPDAIAAGDDEDRWRPIGEIDPTTGRARVDYSLARWRPLSEFWRWR
jgi:hypothetical protein